jgi:hypothetical protein
MANLNLNETAGSSSGAKLSQPRVSCDLLMKSFRLGAPLSMHQSVNQEYLQTLNSSPARVVLGNKDGDSQLFKMSPQSPIQQQIMDQQNEGDL